MGVRVPFYDRDRAETLRATLLVASDSMTGHGLYFNPRPWLLAVTLVLALSILLWLPFVRNITRSIEQMTAAAERIAEERFDVRVDDRRGDELGRLGKAINHLAARLSGFVGGQKRFLGDISHELNSPLGRMQVALGILEERVEPAQLAYVADAREEVVLMSRLIEELIAYAKAGMKASEIQLTRVNLRQLAERVIECEAASATIHLRIDQMIDVLAQPDLLTRALANVIRNAVRYSQAAGPVTVTAKRQGDLVNLAVTDCGEGPPEESLSKIFDPFYRIEPDRSRQTGGVGLGLAIVKSCVESCQGAVSARKLAPSGFEISFSLRAAS
jgi:two-component system sensor histidine kinase CpxA